MRSRAHELRPGTALGRYLVVSRLGSGGMGVVYAGYDPQLDRKVALKLLHPGSALGSEGSARLLREAQALAKLAHPNVVAIHDTGTVGDNVWLAIEFVAGCTFGGWLHAAPRSWREVLSVMVDAGRGLAAAHAAGLVHRDFKPDNVMVGDDGRVRVMDFGLARASVDPGRDGPAGPVAAADDVSHPRTDDAALDETAAPTASLEDTAAPSVPPSLEDTAAAPRDPSLDDPREPALARTGVREPAARPSRSALDEALTREGSIAGTPAYMAPEQFAADSTDGRTNQFSFCVTLWEALYGARPFHGSSFAELAAHVLDGVPPALPRQRRVPVWIGKLALRGLARRPEDRWPSMDALLAELARGRGRARNRRLLAVLGASALGLVGLAGARALEIRRSTLACERDGAAIDEIWNEDTALGLRAGLLASGDATAEVTAEKVTPWLAAQASALRDATAAACMDAHVHAAMDSDQLARATWCLDDARMQLAAVVQQLSRADARALHSSVWTAASLTSVARCRNPELLERMPMPPLERRDEVDALRRELSQVSALEASASYAPALTLARDVLARSEALGWPPLVADARRRLASALMKTGEFAEAEAELEDAFFTAARSGAPTLGAAIAEGLVVLVGARMRRHDDGVRWSKLAELLQPDPQGTELARHLMDLATIAQARGDHDDAIGLYERALAIDEVVLGPEHPNVALTLSNLAVSSQDIAQNAKAREQLERALTIRERVFGSEHPDVASTLSNLASVYRDLGEPARARELYHRALAIREKVFGPDSYPVAEVLNNLANVLRDTGAGPESVVLLERALRIMERRLGPDHPNVATALINLAWLHQDHAEFAQARTRFERALASMERKLGSEHPDLCPALLGLAQVAFSERRFIDAVELAERALLLRERAAVVPVMVAEAQIMLARALWEVGSDRPRAYRLADAALATYVAGPPSELDYREELEAWLREHPR